MLKKSFYLLLLLNCIGLEQSLAQYVGDIMIGKASFYHNKFQGKRMSNGDSFDNNDFTAAHMTLPFETILEVTNLANKNKVTVRVTDRGPYAGERLIDLSRVAAEVLGIVNDGVAEVSVTIIKLPDNDQTYTGFINYGSFDTTAFRRYEKVLIDSSGGRFRILKTPPKPVEKPKPVAVALPPPPKKEFDEMGFRIYEKLKVETSGGKVKVVVDTTRKK